MALTAQQIVTRVCSICKAPGYTQQAGQYLNTVLSDLSQSGNYDIIKLTTEGVFNPSLISSDPLIVNASGPYPLPANFLRMVKGDAIWYLLGVPYQMIPITLQEFDLQVQQVGLQSYPYLVAVDMSQTPPVFYIWPPASGAFPYRFRYFPQTADITTPETSSAIPWFPNQRFLITQTAADLMEETGDTRRAQFLGEAQRILLGYVQMKDNRSEKAITVTLDRRRWGTRFSTLPNTKVVGW